jgi:type II secretory ATPase GspE/PulE/Tfp pilus assembly ATPase PilB-like protein
MEAYEDQAVAYLRGEMSGEERAAFEESLARSEGLRTALSRSRELLELLEAASEKSIAGRVEGQIRGALSRRASDLHLTPDAREGVVRVRVDGVLAELERYPREQHEAVIDRWKLLAGASVTERAEPQAGRVVMTEDGKEMDLRVQFLPTFQGERVTARVLDPITVQNRLERLSFSPEHLEVVRRLIALRRGLIVCSGPTASGKGTVLYAMLMEMDREARNVMTLEEPVQHVLPGVSQITVRRRAGFSYAEALRSVLLSDPDVVMVHELTDHEAAGIAVEAAATGPLVPTTLHAPSAAAALARLQEFGISPERIAQALAGVIAQRLVPKVCPECAEPYRPPAESLAPLGLLADDPGPFRRGRGCPACSGTGCRGRVALYEIMEVNGTVRSLLLRTIHPDEIWAATFGARGGSLRDDAARKVRDGLATAEAAAAALADYPHPAAKLA